MNHDDLRRLLSATPGEPPLPPDPVALVHRRIRRRQRRLRAGALAVVLIAAGVTTSLVVPGSHGSDGTSRLDVVAPTVPPPSPTPAAGSSLLLVGSQGVSSATGGGARIADRVRSGLVNPSRELLGTAGVIGVSTPDGDQLIYNSWSWASPQVAAQSSYANGELLGSPSIHVYDTVTGHDSVLAEHAQSVALAGDGAVAYFQASQSGYRSGQPLTGQVIVRAGIGATPHPWTVQQGRYTVLAWAGRSLLIQRTPADQEGGGPIYVLDGPGRLRVINQGADSVFLAVSPDGQQVLTSEGDIGDGTLRLRAVSTGSVIWSSKISALFPASHSVSPLASWVGNDVLLTGSDGAGSALLPLTSTPQHLIAGPAVSVPASITPFLMENAVLSGSRTATGVGFDAPPSAPQPTDTTKYVIVTCELSSGTCTRSPTGENVYHQQLSEVRNLSRPLAPSVPDAQR